MIDPFALLDEPRRPWLDPDSLKAKFLSLSATVHPDRVQSSSEQERKTASDRFAEFNAAYTRLLDSKTRLQVLLELELGTPPAQVQSVGQNHVALFNQVSELCRKADRFLDGATKELSPLLKVQVVGENDSLTRELNDLQNALIRVKETLENELRQLNPVWDSAPPIGSVDRLKAIPFTRLSEIYRDLGFLKRWTNQLQDRFVRLSIQLNNLLQ